jgi:hypothetical protein
VIIVLICAATLMAADCTETTAYSVMKLRHEPGVLCGLDVEESEAATGLISDGAYLKIICRQ